MIYIDFVLGNFNTERVVLCNLVLDACVAAVKCRPVFHHFVVIFFWSSGIMECALFTFENTVPLVRLGASVVWHLSLPLMNSFNKSEAAFWVASTDAAHVFVSFSGSNMAVWQYFPVMVPDFYYNYALYCKC